MVNNPTKENIEVEIRALVEDIGLLRKQLISQGGKYHGEYYLHDIYFCRREYTRLKEVEMNKVGSYGLRLRNSKDYDGKLEATLNSKTITKEGDHNAWEEHEIAVGDFVEAAKILLLTEFKPFFELEKTRHRYVLDGFDIFVEDIKDFGCCIEVEIMTVPGHEEEAKNQILTLLDRLGIKSDQIVAKSVTNLIMHERAFKQSIKI